MTEMQRTKPSLHIGKCIKEQLAQKGKSTVWLAEQLGYHRTNLYKLYDKPTIDTGILLRVSKIIGYNFFHLYESIVNDS